MMRHLIPTYLMTNELGVKFDQGKNKLGLVPPEYIEACGRALTFGAEKYSARNWEKGMEYTQVYSALQRHLNAWWKGIENDVESDLCHLDHAAACLAFLIAMNERKIGVDDRT